MKPQIGYIYYLDNFTAPKVFDGQKYVCLLTSQLIRRNTKIIEATGKNLKTWEHEIWQPERFNNIRAGL